MPNPVVGASIVLGLVYDELNVATATYNTFNDAASGQPRWQQASLVNWMVNAELEVQRACAESPGSSYRNYFVTTPATLANGAALPATMIGPPQAIWITGADGISRPARPSNSIWIGYFNTDTDNVFGPASFTDGEYSVIDNRLYFSGVSAQVYYCTIARATAPALPSLPTLTAPEAFTNTLVKAVCGWACQKEQDFMQESQSFLEQYYSDLQSIKAGAMEVPPVQLVQKQAA